jgi:hypothetical protein
VSTGNIGIVGTIGTGGTCPEDQEDARSGNGLEEDTDPMELRMPLPSPRASMSSVEKLEYIEGGLELFLLLGWELPELGEGGHSVFGEGGSDPEYWIARSDDVRLRDESYVGLEYFLE